MEESLEPYRAAFAEAEEDERDQVGLELCHALYTLLRYARKKKPVDPRYRALARSFSSRWESPWVLFQLARFDVEAARGIKDPVARAEEVERAAAWVERGLALQPDHYLLLYQRAALLELRAGLAGDPADLERACDVIELSHLLGGYSEPTRLEQRLRERLGRK